MFVDLYIQNCKVYMELRGQGSAYPLPLLLQGLNSVDNMIVILRIKHRMNML